MKIISNTRLIQRNKKISQIILYLSLALLGIGMIWSLSNPETSQLSYVYGIIIPAYILVQISIYFANRWGRSPRPDEIIEQSLKGLDNQFYLYHYSTGIPHLLIGPMGIWIIQPYHQSGDITYNPDKRRYEQKGGANLLSKLFAQEGLTNIENDSKRLIRDFNKYLKTQNINIKIQPVVVNVFYSKKAEVHAHNAPYLAMHINKLKDTVRSYMKQSKFSKDEIVKINELLNR